MSNVYTQCLMHTHKVSSRPMKLLTMAVCLCVSSFTAYASQLDALLTKKIEMMTKLKGNYSLC